jgi:hypothetical protein
MSLKRCFNVFDIYECFSIILIKTIETEMHYTI